MPGKLIMTWDINPEHEQEYFEFVVREFLPHVQRLGFQMSDAWVTVYGEQPQIMVGATLPTIAEINQVLRSEEWDALIVRLLDYVTDFKYKIVSATGGFQF
ncbi:hypothetical protein [Pelolinea submarina]|uniref:Uncharacterized protein n=1 Tax=Pelolinea submarina TaxID=913107 RepID=A0A347ZN97_9CHLR|nr:hypothetical protein [Pelolinea submarina]REG05556.1 hypothetical protein DFR64_2965 [Pelolinea submarina]BBB46778.1 hypothetical protein Pelsub_P0005 [Pelolinea submarina]